MKFVVVIWHEMNRKNTWMVGGQSESQIRTNALLVLEKDSALTAEFSRRSQDLRGEKILSYC